MNILIPSTTERLAEYFVVAGYGSNLIPLDFHGSDSPMNMCSSTRKSMSVAVEETDFWTESLFPSKSDIFDSYWTESHINKQIAERIRVLESYFVQCQKFYYEAEVLDRYPDNNKRNCKSTMQFPEGVHMFCFPNGGIVVSTHADIPSVYSFCCTLGNGDKQYGSCVAFREQVPVSHLRKQFRMMEEHTTHKDQWKGNISSPLDDASVTDAEKVLQTEIQAKPYEMLPFFVRQRVQQAVTAHQSTQPVLWADKCLCIQSYFPYLTQFRCFLTEMFRLSMSKSIVPIERYIGALLNDTPVPPHGEFHIKIDLAELSTVPQEEGEILVNADVSDQEELCDIPTMDLQDICMTLRDFLHNHTKLIATGMTDELLPPAPPRCVVHCLAVDLMPVTPIHSKHTLLPSPMSTRTSTTANPLYQSKNLASPPLIAPVLKFQPSMKNSKVLHFARPPLNLPLAPLAIGIYPLFKLLSLEIVIQILENQLLERKVLLVSRHLSILTPIAEALILQLFPFQYPHVYVPLLPSRQIEFFEAPFPYLIGVHRSTFEMIDPSNLEDVVVVNLDKNSLTCETPCIELPPKQRTKLLRRLPRLLQEFKRVARRDPTLHFHVSDQAAFLPPLPDDVEEELVEEQELMEEDWGSFEHPDQNSSAAKLEYCIKRVFYRAFQSLFYQFHEYCPNHVDVSTLTPPKPEPFEPGEYYRRIHVDDSYNPSQSSFNVLLVDGIAFSIQSPNSSVHRNSIFRRSISTSVSYVEPAVKWTSEVGFQQNAFLKVQPANARPFLLAMFETQVWNVFCDQRLIADLAMTVAPQIVFFYESAIDKKNRGMFTRAKPTPFLNTKDYRTEHTQLVNSPLGMGRSRHIECYHKLSESCYQDVCPVVHKVQIRKSTQNAKNPSSSPSFPRLCNQQFPKTTVRTPITISIDRQAILTYAQQYIGVLLCQCKHKQDIYTLENGYLLLDKKELPVSLQNQCYEDTRVLLKMHWSYEPLEQEEQVYSDKCCSFFWLSSVIPAPASAPMNSEQRFSSKEEACTSVLQQWVDMLEEFLQSVPRPLQISISSPCDMASPLPLSHSMTVSVPDLDKSLTMCVLSPKQYPHTPTRSALTSPMHRRLASDAAKYTNSIGSVAALVPLVLDMLIVALSEREEPVDQSYRDGNTRMLLPTWVRSKLGPIKSAELRCLASCYTAYAMATTILPSNSLMENITFVTTPKKKTYTNTTSIITNDTQAAVSPSDHAMTPLKLPSANSTAWNNTSFFNSTNHTKDSTYTLQTNMDILRAGIPGLAVTLTMTCGCTVTIPALIAQYDKQAEGRTEKGIFPNTENPGHQLSVSLLQSYVEIACPVCQKTETPELAFDWLECKESWCQSWNQVPVVPVYSPILVAQELSTLLRKQHIDQLYSVECTQVYTIQSMNMLFWTSIVLSDITDITDQYKEMYQLSRDIQ